MRYLAAIFLLTVLSGSVRAAEVLVIEVPGGSFRGTVHKITEHDVVLKEGSGRLNHIPIQMLKPRQLYLCKKNMLDPKDAKAALELGNWCTEKGLKQEAEDEFLAAVRIDPGVREQALELLGKASKREVRAPTTKAVAKLEYLKAAELNHVDVYKRCAPAVVGLFCKGTTPSGQESGYTGTGAVVSPDGLILTSVTVIPKDAKEIKVYFTDGQIRPATLKAFDAPSEGVLIQVEAKGLPFMKVADSKTYQVGDPLYSWGNPHMTISRDGMVSLSVGSICGMYDVSSVDDQSRYMGPVLETDAAINPGSDGGPLTDAEGNLVGITSLAFSRSRWLGLAIPTSRLMEALPDLKPLAKASRPKLAGELSRCWSFHQAFGEVSAAALEATVAIRVVYQGDKPDVPADRNAEELKPLEPYHRMQRAAREAQRPPDAASSGFFVDAEGTVVTAAFNVGPEYTWKRTGNKIQRQQRNPAKVYVYLADGTRLEAKVAAKDNFYDLAVLKVQAPKGRSFPYLALYDSGELVQGSSVAVVGRSEPPGEPTLNSGRVSAAGRYRGTCCQISSMINYGNLGGPVVDLQGRVVGMAAHLAERTSWRQNCGVGFMLQAEIIQQVLPDLLAGKQASHPKQATIGAVGDMGALDLKGARITRVDANGPAAQAGLQPGDIILSFDGKPIEDWLTLETEIRAAEPAKQVPLKVRRGDQELDLSIELGEKE